MAKKAKKGTKDNNEEELKIDDLDLDLEVDQWEIIVEKTYDTVKNDKKYKNMTLEKFQKIIFTKENNKMIQGKIPKGMDWKKDFIKPMFLTFIDSVNIILYYFISYYLIQF